MKTYIPTREKEVRQPNEPDLGEMYQDSKNSLHYIVIQHEAIYHRTHTQMKQRYHL